jgi:hypothetical protein
VPGSSGIVKRPLNSERSVALGEITTTGQDWEGRGVVERVRLPLLVEEPES